MLDKYICKIYIIYIEIIEENTFIIKDVLYILSNFIIPIINTITLPDNNNYSKNNIFLTTAKVRSKACNNTVGQLEKYLQSSLVPGIISISLPE